MKPIVKPIVLANFKASLSPLQLEQWVERFLADLVPSTRIEIVLAVPSLCLRQVAGRVKGVDGVELASQIVSGYPSGSYTGMTPAVWLQGIAKYVLIGHREQRRYFHHSFQEVANQAGESVAAGLTPILCLEREDAIRQLASLDHSVLEKTIPAYTPSDGEQLEIARDEKVIEEAMQTFRALSGGRPVLYGGGVNEENGAGLISLQGVSGIMAARGCLEPGSFVNLLRKVETVCRS